MADPIVTFLKELGDLALKERGKKLTLIECKYNQNSCFICVAKRMKDYEIKFRRRAKNHKMMYGALIHVNSKSISEGTEFEATSFCSIPELNKTYTLKHKKNESYVNDGGAMQFLNPRNAKCGHF